MTRRNHAVRGALFASTILAAVSSAFAADVTLQRLRNPDREAQSWLMNDRRPSS